MINNTPASNLMATAFDGEKIVKPKLNSASLAEFS
jgi:hypothetical protein